MITIADSIIAMYRIFVANDSQFRILQRKTAFNITGLKVAITCFSL